MLDEHEHEFNHVLIIESLPPGDLRTGRELYEDALMHMFGDEFPWISHELIECPGKECFLSVLDELAHRCAREGCSPVLHIESHGSCDGILLGNAERLAWEELKAPLRAINIASSLSLLVVLAACSGRHLLKVLHPLERAPVWGIIGPEREIAPLDLRYGLERFYRTLLETRDGRKALEAWNQRPLGEPWDVGFASAAFIFRECWREYFRAHASDDATAARIDRIIEMLLERGVDLSNEHEAALRENALAFIQMPDVFFDRATDNYFMKDVFPGNEGRFKLTLKDVREANE